MMPLIDRDAALLSDVKPITSVVAFLTQMCRAKLISSWQEKGETQDIITLQCERQN
jgi:hypothetical protein